MRIKGYGNGTGGFGGGRERSDSFRNKHRLGQKIRGKLIKNIADNMAWVDFNGNRLLAQLANPHSEGSLLLFIIKQLNPQIILKELGANHADGTNALNLANTFDTTRTLFEKKFWAITKACSLTQPSLSCINFMKIIATNSELFACYMDASNCARSISNALLDAKRGTIIYQPWLASESHRQVTLVKETNHRSKMTESIVEFDHPSMGLVRIEFFHKAKTVAYKLKMQRPQHSAALMRFLSTKKHHVNQLNLQHLGISKLPQSGHGGILAELLFRTENLIK
nr:hypothetical protein [uncultured Pseudodesulfovibrio sp.]